MSVAQSFAKANQAYAASFGDKGGLALPPSKKVAVVTCMDARLHPEKALGILEGDAHVIRNAGGRASDALRSIVISQTLLGTREVVVIHHTDCGMLTFKDDDARKAVKSAPHATKRRQLWSIRLREFAKPTEARLTAFLPFSDLDQSVRDDVEYLRSHALVHQDSKQAITGWVYEVETGKIRQTV